MSSGFYCREFIKLYRFLHIILNNIFFAWFDFLNCRYFDNKNFAMITTELLLRKALHGSHDGILFLKGETIIDCNDVALQLLNIQEPDYIGKSIYDFSTHKTIRNGKTIDIDSVIFCDFINGFKGKQEWEFNGNCNEKKYVEVEVSKLDIENSSYSVVFMRDISRRKRFDLMMNARLSLLEFSSNGSRHDIFQKALEEIKLLVGGEIGYLYLHHKEDKRISLKAYSSNTSTFCPINNQSLLINLGDKEVYQTLIKRTDAIVNNRLNEEGRSSILPVSDCILTNEMLMPIVRNRFVVAIVGIANKPSSFENNDMVLARTMGELVWDIAERKQVEENLLQSQKNLIEAQKLAKLGFWEYSFYENTFVCNDEIREIFQGDLPTQIIFDDVVKIIHPDDIDRVLKYFEYLLQELDTGQCDYRIINASGTVRYLTTSVYCNRTSDRRPIKIISTVYDITSRMLIEKALHDSEERFRSIYETSSVGMVLAYADTTIIAANRAYCQIIGETEYNIVGNPITHFTHPGDRIWEQHLISGLQNMQYESTEVEQRYITADGELRWVHITYNYYRNSDNAIEHLILIVENITERKRAEYALVESEGNFRAFFDNSVISLLVFDLEGKILRVNEKACELLDYSEGQLRKMNFVKCVAESSQKDIQTILTFQKNASVVNLLSKTGIEIPVSLHVGKGMWGSNEAFFCMARDLSDLRRSEEKFNKAFHHNGNAMILATHDEFRIIEANQKSLSLSGYSLEEVVGKTDLELNLTVDFDLREKIMALENTDEPFETLCQIRIRNGDVIFVNLAISTISIHKKTYFLATLVDLTEKIETEKALRNSETRLKEITENVQEGIILANLDFQYVFVNSTFSKMTGYTKNELMKMKIHQLVVNEGDFAMARKLKSEGGSVIRRFVAMKRKNGEVFYINVAAKRITIGDEDYILGTQQDVTQEFEAEQKLRRAYEEISSLKNQLEQENFYLKQEIKKTHHFSDIITQNIQFKQVLNQVEIVAPTDASVLIFGETGTGKELIASAIHKQSRRSAQTMVKLNCAAIPQSLIESELFGHEKGAFTGAFQQKIGRFEIANGGTLFLDEIGEMPIELQSKLLRVLQEGEFERIGGTKTIKVNVRIISATNRNLQEEIENGRFRRDLFYRLNVFPVYIPALRERVDDIPLLTNYFVERFNNKFNKSIVKVPQKIMNSLLDYNWPGNIRELENLIERSVLLSSGSVLSLAGWEIESSNTNKKKPFVSFEEMQKQYIADVLEFTNWRISGENGATKILGLKYSTLMSKMQKLNISRSKT
jgi:PAS domain S-box-containing protein